MNSMKKQKDMTLEVEPLDPRSVGIQYATGKEQRNSSRKTAVPKRRQRSVVAVSGSKV